MKILLIEDETGIADLVREGLQDAHYRVDVAKDGQTGLEMARTGTYHLILLDLMLPGRDGWSVCAELRAQRNRVPILMLTARDTVQDRIRGLDIGADDYLPKPFAFTELMARVRALLRRDKVHRPRMIRIADLEIDEARYRVTRAGEEIRLSRREYDLLVALVAHEGKILTREAIHEHIWMCDDTLSNTVNVYIGLLRKKIDAAHPVKLIHTVHGMGYTLRQPESEAEA
jgi:two-component system copper resistance phosphate regulon response regulator CusR